MISGWNCLTNRNTVTCRMKSLRPPARREQSRPFVAEKRSPAHLPLPEMRQAGTGDRADGPAH